MKLFISGNVPIMSCRCLSVADISSLFSVCRDIIFVISCFFLCCVSVSLRFCVFFDCLFVICFLFLLCLPMYCGSLFADAGVCDYMCIWLLPALCDQCFIISSPSSSHQFWVFLAFCSTSIVVTRRLLLGWFLAIHDLVCLCSLIFIVCVALFVRVLFLPPIDLPLCYSACFLVFVIVG